MTRTGAKHTSKDNETHTLPQKAVSTTSCDCLLWERTREQEKKRARKTETKRESKKVRHMWMQLYSGGNHTLYVSSCLLSGSFFLRPLSLSSLFWPSLFWHGSAVPKTSLRCAEVREKQNKLFFFLVRAHIWLSTFTIPRSCVHTQVN